MVRDHARGDDARIPLLTVLFDLENTVWNNIKCAGPGTVFREGLSRGYSKRTLQTVFTPHKNTVCDTKNRSCLGGKARRA